MQNCIVARVEFGSNEGVQLFRVNLQAPDSLQGQAGRAWLAIHVRNRLAHELGRSNRVWILFQLLQQQDMDGDLHVVQRALQLGETRSGVSKLALAQFIQRKQRLERSLQICIQFSDKFLGGLEQGLIKRFRRCFPFFDRRLTGLAAHVVGFDRLFVAHGLGFLVLGVVHALVIQPNELQCQGGRGTFIRLQIVSQPLDRRGSQFRVAVLEFRVQSIPEGLNKAPQKVDSFPQPPELIARDQRFSKPNPQPQILGLGCQSLFA